jgi:hypothetical protein
VEYIIFAFSQTQVTEPGREELNVGQDVHDDVDITE